MYIHLIHNSDSSFLNSSDSVVLSLSLILSQTLLWYQSLESSTAMDPVNDSPIQPPSSSQPLDEDPLVNSQSSLPPVHRVTFNHPLAIKLEDKNYLLWRRQVLATVKGRYLGHFLDRTAKTPP